MLDFLKFKYKKNFKKYNFCKNKFLNYYILVFLLPSVQWIHHFLPCLNIMISNREIKHTQTHARVYLYIYIDIGFL